MDMPLCASYFKSLIILRAECESNPDVGSSRRRTLGLVTNSYPIVVLFFSPPDKPFIMSPPYKTFLQLSNPSLFIN